MQEPKIIVVSGEFGSGKTLFGLTTGYPPEGTLVFDLEKSSLQYEVMGFVRLDLLQEVRAQKANWRSVDLWEAFVDRAAAVEPGAYDVILIDPISELEVGLADWVLANPKMFGRSASGIYWGDVKALEKRMLLDLAARCKMLILTAHMRDQWRGNKPTGRRERKGKETLTEISDLELVLERKPNQQVPSARVVRCRLVWINPDDAADIRPALPPRLPVATWKAIRQYLERPPQWDDLNEEEKVHSKPLLTEEERLLLEAQIAQAKAETPVHTCAVCGKPITDYHENGRVWTVDAIVRTCHDKGLPLLCVPCAREHLRAKAA